MERKEIEAELNEVERDLADIARRAHIAASNLRSVADGCDVCAEEAEYRIIAENIDDIEGRSEVLRRHFQNTRSFYNRHAVALMEGGAE